MPKQWKKSKQSSLITCRKLTILTVSAVLIQILGLSLFISAFFPVKPSLSGFSGLESFYPPDFDSNADAPNASTLPPEKLKSLYQELSGVPPLYDRLILMVIDGLPAEFILGRNGKPPPKAFLEAMPYTQSLLDRGLAIGYHAKAAPPTVTMPRLKAMVSGAIGGFLDVASNFNTQAFLDDNLIAQCLKIGWRMVMLGDETWLKMFPNMFYRHDGVSSFFVKDTIQVDYNVSRHLTNELKSTDWDLLILHYLGLDHVGHIGGRNSILMGPKLMEMDEVIKRIHSSITQTQEVHQRGTLLMIASDHGMTEGGNHGGASYEEADSLALFASTHGFSDAKCSNEAYQVDIASTLALLFGMPIPKNNVGTVMAEVFSSLEDDKKLRILELNSWQLLRLLQTHLTESGCGLFSCESGIDIEDGPEKICCSYLYANALHESWKLRNTSRSSQGDDYRSIVLAYHYFLQAASKWLSSRSTDKPVGLLACGLLAMLLSCLGLVSLLFLFGQGISFKGSQHYSRKWNSDENFVIAVIFILIFSMGSSSMIEEEQYVWHFMTSSLFLILLRRTMQTITNCFRPVYYIIGILVCGRILRGWHQGGVNWSYLTDISKLLEQAGTFYIKSLQLLSLVTVIIICSAVLMAARIRTRLAMSLVVIFLFPALMIIDQILKHQSTTVIQIIYALLGTSTLGILFSTPWLMPLENFSRNLDVSGETLCKLLLDCFRSCIFVIGWCFIFSWCLLQLLLQQPINSVPISLLLMEIIGSIHYFSDSHLHVEQWVKVAALYYVGMAGHFGLGNTNTLATIDVAGAFMGISSHSTFISGILMFIITYASPMVALLSMLMMTASTKDKNDCGDENDVDFGHLLKMNFGYPCLVPLVLNSILLLGYTILLLLMQSHLFIWSVFSPKYMYVCATTVCVYIGTSVLAVTATYTCFVFSLRQRKLKGILQGYQY